MSWPWRASPAEPAIDREDVLAIIAVLADIKVWTYEIHAHLLDDDAEEEENA